MARDYGRIAPTFWTGETGKKIRRSGKEQVILACYLQTCRNSNLIGLYYLPIPTICHETSLTHVEATAALGMLATIDNFALYDHEQEFVWLPTMAAHQIGLGAPPWEPFKATDKRLGAIRRFAHEARKSICYPSFIARYGTLFGIKKGLEGSDSIVASESEEEIEFENEVDLNPPLELLDLDDPASPGDMDKQPAHQGLKVGPGAEQLSVVQAGQPEGFDFDAVYALYPRKLGRKKGIALCRRQIRTRARYEQLLLAVKHYAMPASRRRKRSTSSTSTHSWAAGRTTWILVPRAPSTAPSRHET
jgi:hypothetical protein